MVKRSAALDAPAGVLVASATGAAALGNLGWQVSRAGLRLSQAVFEQSQGLEEVATGEIKGLVVSRFESAPRLRLALASHPELTAMPLGDAGPTTPERPGPVMPAPDATIAFDAIVTGSASETREAPAAEPATTAAGPAAQAFATIETAQRSATPTPP